mgnify:CR=1 FL=1
MTTRPTLLLQERPLIVLPQLACAVGLNEAIVLQQLHYWLIEGGTPHEGRRWVYNSYEQWQVDNFPFWSLPTIRRVFGNLERDGLISSRVEYDRRFQGSRRKWYTINYDAVREKEGEFLNGHASRDQVDHDSAKVAENASRDQVDQSSRDQSDQTSGDQNDQTLYTENTTENTKIAPVAKNATGARAAEPEAKTPKSKTPNQLMFDAICAAFSYDPTAITKSRRGGINRTIAELLAVGATPADIPGLHAYCAREFERFGPNALSKNWPDYKASRAPRQTRNGSASAPVPKPRPDCEQCGGTGLIIAVHPDGREETVPCPDCRAAAESARKEEAIHA